MVLIRMTNGTYFVRMKWNREPVFTHDTTAARVFPEEKYALEVIRANMATLHGGAVWPLALLTKGI